MPGLVSLLCLGLILLGDMRGHGAVLSNGGPGSGTGGGGAGGRIAIHTRYDNEYHGTLQADGSSSSGSGSNINETDLSL